MTRVFAFLAVVALLIAPGCQRQASDEAQTGSAGQEQEKAVNVLARSLSRYSAVIMWQGARWGERSAQELDQQRAKNIENVRAMVKAGTLVGAASVTGNADCKSIYFLKTESLSEAISLVGSAYSVQEELFSPEVHTVYGTKGLGEALRESPGEVTSEMPATTYYLAIYSKGDGWREEADEVTRNLSNEHAKRILSLKESGKLKFYAVIADMGPTRAIAIFQAASLDQARAQVMNGQAVKTEWFTARVYEVTVPEGILP